jgi:flagellar hook assembly protein FlgD
LDQNYPNPFNPSTLISFSMPKQSNVSLKIYNMLGQEIVALISNEIVGSGKYSVEWNGKDAANQSVATGVYVYQLKADNTVISKKMLLVK